MEPYPKQCHCLPEPWKPPRPSFPALPVWTTKTRAQRSVYISHCLLYAQPCVLQAIMCVRCFRARRRKHRQKEVLYKAACNKTFEDGRESGGKSDHLWLEKSRRTSWRWQHFYVIPSQRWEEKGKEIPQPECVDICVLATCRLAPKQGIY